MSDLEKTTPSLEENETKEQQYSLSDDRRVKVLSPGMLVAKRFFRNRLAVTGLVILALMFVFSFVGGLVSPYKQDQKFYRVDAQTKDYAGVVYNDEFRYSVGNADLFKGVVQGKAGLAIAAGETTFDYNDVTYTLESPSENIYIIKAGDEVVGIASKEVVSSSTDNSTFDFDFTYSALTTAPNSSFTYNGATYTVDADKVIFDAEGNEFAYVSQYVVRAVMSDVFFTREYKQELIDTIDSGASSFTYTGEDGVEAEYTISYDAQKKTYFIKQEIDTTIFDTYSGPSKSHWLGTDRNGMDMLTRLMYGGRISLIIGFVVVIIETLLGIILGGISGYFGGWIDNLIMRIVDIFYCIPMMPIIIIIGAAMDAANLPSLTRMMYLMLILGFLGWPGIARMVRGQILSLREQEFMMATEATGISVPRRIFKHLIPNVVPQLIVIMTMGLGNTIIMEATLSFLGLGVRFPFASWGNIINDVNDVYVLTHYWFIWIPAGVLLLLTVLAFNIVGDGLRDAFDPKMKR